MKKIHFSTVLPAFVLVLSFTAIGGDVDPDPASTTSFGTQRRGR